MENPCELKKKSKAEWNWEGGGWGELEEEEEVLLQYTSVSGLG